MVGAGGGKWSSLMITLACHRSGSALGDTNSRRLNVFYPVIVTNCGRTTFNLYDTRTKIMIL